MTFDMAGATVGEERSGRARILRVRPPMEEGDGFRIIELQVANSAGPVTWGWLWGDSVRLANGLSENQIVEVRATVAAAWDGSPRELDIQEIRPIETVVPPVFREHPERIYAELSRPLAYFILQLLWLNSFRNRSEWQESTVEEVNAFTAFLEDALPPGAHGKRPRSHRPKAA